MLAFRSCGICTLPLCNFGTQDACSVRVTLIGIDWPDGSGAPKGLASDSLKP